MLGVAAGVADAGVPGEVEADAAAVVAFADAAAAFFKDAAFSSSSSWSSSVCVRHFMGSM